MTINQLPDSVSSRSGGAGQIPLTLPVASRPFSRIRFAQIDSQARAVSPDGAFIWLAENIQQGTEIRAVDLDGPGDPLAEIDSTMEILTLIRHQYPDLALSVTTLGIQGEIQAKALTAAGVSRVTLLVDAVDHKVAEKLYAWIRPGRKTVPLVQATGLLMDEQLRAVKAFRAAGCIVTIRSTVYPGFNDDHIEEIARVMAESGAETMTLVPYRTGADQEEQLLNPPDPATMQRLQEKAAKYLTTFLFTKNEKSPGFACPSQPGTDRNLSVLLTKPSKTRPNVAVVSSNGMEVDLHLGQACRVLIYGPREDGLTCLLTTRPVPKPGNGSSRWEDLAASLEDCFAILTASAGKNPRQILGKRGITVLITDNDIEGTVDVLFGGSKKGKCKK